MSSDERDGVDGMPVKRGKVEEEMVSGGNLIISRSPPLSASI